MEKEIIKKATGKCPFCTINLYLDEKTGKEKPIIFPCGVRREKPWKNQVNKTMPPFDCPWETPEEQSKLLIVRPEEIIAGLLGTGRVE